MSEKDPSLVLHLGSGRKFEMTPENSMLYTYLGRTAIGNMEIDNSSVNHAWVTTGHNEQGQATGMYFFAEFDDVYKDIAAHMVEHKYPMLLNQRTVPECDMKAWVARVDLTTAQFVASIPDTLPDK